MLDGEIVQICRQEEEEEEDSCIKQLASWYKTLPVWSLVLFPADLTNMSKMLA
jgi:hypothetical protein